jgi:hypothetical protein
MLLQSLGGKPFQCYQHSEKGNILTSTIKQRFDIRAPFASMAPGVTLVNCPRGVCKFDFTFDIISKFIFLYKNLYVI